MMSSYIQQTHDPNSMLECTARKILVCPCHDGAAREFHEMPVAAQDQVWSDLIGEESRRMGLAPEDEPPETIEEGLLQLNLELSNLLSQPSEASLAGLHMAMTDHPDYVQDPIFLLKFLRAERFEIAAAAQRMVIHFECKLALWGPERLGREIFFSDLEEDDLHCLSLGFFQILSELDHGGRRVFFYYKALSGCYRHRTNLLRVMWYLMNALSHDAKVQKLGAVNVVYNVGGFPEKGMDYEKSRLVSRLMRGIPIRFDSFIVCLDEAPWLAVVEAFSFMVGKFIRVRMRALLGMYKIVPSFVINWLCNAARSCGNHCICCVVSSLLPFFLLGSHTECMYKLMALGVPYFSMPVTDDSVLIVEKQNHVLNEILENEHRARQMQLEKQTMEAQL